MRHVMTQYLIYRKEKLVGIRDTFRKAKFYAVRNAGDKIVEDIGYVGLNDGGSISEEIVWEGTAGNMQMEVR